MAGNQNSGGYRPTAPQNNPANISATGGNGQSGQPRQYIPGMPYGQGQATMQQQAGAKMYSDTAPQQTLPEVTPITAPTQLPDQHVMDGAALGPGANTIPNLPTYLTNDPDIQAIQNELPVMEFWANQPGASQGTRDYVAYLKTIVAKPGGMA